MRIHNSRREFLGKLAAGGGAAALFNLGGFSTTDAANGRTAFFANSAPNDLPTEFPRQDIESVREVVGASHGRFDRVKELVLARPALAKASWDWGFGDWETALGAASHMGRNDIAEFLIEHGAHPNIFTFAMLGKLSAVQSIVESMPGVQKTPGPHGITLLQHARNRLRRKDISTEDKANVEQVVEYLESIGDADIGEKSIEISEKQMAMYFGDYRFTDGEMGVFTVELNRRGRLYLSRGKEIGRTLNLVEQHGFAPSGAPAVRIRFEVVENKTVSLTIHDPEPLVKAVRV